MNHLQKPPISDPGDAESLALIRAVGERVRRLRNEAGLSRRALSESSGVSPRYLAQLEAGEGNISIGLLNRVALALSADIGLLLAAEDDPAEAGDIARRYRNADARTRAQVRAILDPDTYRRDKAERICLIGLRGAGKSTLGTRVAQTFGLPFVELNREIEQQAGIPVGEIMALYGDEGYRQLEADTVETIIADHDRVVLAVAGGIVSDAQVFARVLERFHTVWLRAQPEEHMARVRSQGDLRPMAGNPQAMAQLRQILRSREALYAQAAHHLDTSGRTADAAFADLCDLVRRHDLIRTDARP